MARRHERTHSTRRPIRAGVPQGSALSPLLYSAYTNAIPRPTSGVQLALFADDTALFFRSRDRRSIFRHIPRAIDKLDQWFRKWRIEVNSEKSAAIQFKLINTWETRSITISISEITSRVLEKLRFESCIETLQCLNSDHRPVLMRTVVENSTRVVPAKSDCKELPSDVSELIRAKNAALRRADKYPTCENRFHACALQRKVKARMKKVRNENWSDLMVEISPSHQTYWGLSL
ncbi:Probable RNA-directed DNA polymerase from transposon X-element [Eumeta japonica]|uniref:Probable RNA-directed DNA polymerase from transposon X-element n=1 Tax=Eumeta variegata TaxID=151549 RepID=A0A4C1WY47_EUMVA|nr:Probable RNA-directed DNA polymerase from transposon X-element [Eumeta japonica]